MPVNPALVLDPNHWQPLTYDDGATAPTPHIVTQSFVGAQWSRVAPFAMTSPDQFRSFVAQFGPALFGSETYLQQSTDLITLSANLTDQQKMIAEYWANGPHTELPPGHWALFGEFVSRRDNHTVDEPYGWIPVDASEAWKHPDKKDYFFGAHDDNRLQFTSDETSDSTHLSRAIHSTTSSILTRSWPESRSR